MSDLICSMIILFATCELADRISTEFDDINDMVNKLDWYSFPVTIQKTLPLIIMNTQKSVGFVCFGSILCNRDTFKKV